MESVEKSAAILEMLETFLQSPAESMVRQYLKRVEEFDIATVRVACVRLAENSRQKPAAADLRQTCGDVLREKRQADPHPEGVEGDWLDQLFADGHLRKLNREPWVERVYIAADDRPAWRNWATARVAEGWSPHECALVIRGEQGRAWVPSDIEGRLERRSAFLEARALRQARPKPAPRGRYESRKMELPENPFANFTSEDIIEGAKDYQREGEDGRRFGVDVDDLF